MLCCLTLLQSAPFNLDAPEFLELRALLMQGAGDLRAHRPHTEQGRASDDANVSHTAKPSTSSGGGSARGEGAAAGTGPGGVPWFLWLFPLLAFLLGTWQIYRWEYGATYLVCMQ